MTVLSAGFRRCITADGGGLDLCALTPDGLEALYREGWDSLRRRLGQPHVWFVAEDLLYGEPAPAVVPDRAFLVSRHRLESERGSGGAEPSGVRWLLYVHPQLSWFAGHFPGRPILPGVVQVGWAVSLGRELGYPDDRFAGLSGVKFASPVLPGAVVGLAVTSSASVPDRLSFVLEDARGVHSRGTLLYRD